MLPVSLLFALLIPLRYTAAAPPSSFIIATSYATLLSGDLGKCPNASAPTCVGGVASCAAIIRDWENQGSEVFYLPYADRATPFVQMHPLEWGVNALVFDYFGWPVYTTPPSFYNSAVRGAAELQSPKRTAKPLVSNVLIGADSDWWPIALRTYVHNKDYGFIALDSQFEPNSIAGVSSAASALRYLNREGISFTFVMLMDIRWKAAAFTAELQAALGQPSLYPTAVIYTAGAANMTTANGTFIVGILGTDTATMGYATVRFTGSKVTSVSQGSVSLTLPDVLRDAEFLADEAFLNGEGAKAAVNDPVVGNSSAMDIGRSADGIYRYCLAGECGQGNMYTDALRWRYDADVAFTSSGGLRGPGYPAGDVKISNIWAMLPFANTACYSTVLGLTLFEILNYTTSLANFGVSVKTALGDRLLQISGARVQVNPNIAPSRLISVEIYDKATGTYEPLQRLKKYVITADSFVCNSFAPYPTYFGGRYDGEGPMVNSPEIIQNTVANYLQLFSPYNASYQGRYSNATEAAYLSLVQTRSTCASTEYWSPSIASCVACPSGQVATTAGTTCTPAPTNNLLLIISIVAPVVGLTLIALLGFLIKSEIARRKNVRNVANAPTSGDVTLVFTDIQDSTKLWSTVPASMSHALDIHHALIRECIVAHRGYEVKTVGDSFMIACGSVEAGVLIARDIQLKLQETQFPSAIELTYAAETEEGLDAIADDPDKLSPLDPTWNGLRVRVGIHVGRPDVMFDEVAKGYDYYGSPVNIAARVESVAKGGQVLCSAAVTALISDPAAYGVTMSSVGIGDLKGVADPMELFQLCPLSLSARKFANLEKLGTGALFNGVNIESASSHGSIQSEVQTGQSQTVFVERYRKFLTALLKTTNKKDKERFIEQMNKTWRIQRKLSDEDALEAIAKRVVSTMRKELAEESGELLRGGSMMLGHVQSFNASVSKTDFAMSKGNDGRMAKKVSTNQLFAGSSSGGERRSSPTTVPKRPPGPRD